MHREAQVLRRDGRLSEARQRFLACTSERCPTAYRNECATLVQEVEAAQPTVLLVAESDGLELVTAQVTISRADLKAPARRMPLSGSPITLDPGHHQFEFRLSDGRVRVVSALLREGEKRRRIVADFGVAEPARAQGRGIDPAVYVAGAVAAAALATSLYFYLSGRVESLCAPECTEDEVESISDSYLIGDVAAGAMLVSLAAGSYFLLSPAWNCLSGEAGHASESTRVGIAAYPGRNGGVAISAATRF